MQEIFFNGPRHFETFHADQVLHLLLENAIHQRAADARSPCKELHVRFGSRRQQAIAVNPKLRIGARHLQDLFHDHIWQFFLGSLLQCLLLARFSMEEESCSRVLRRLVLMAFINWGRMAFGWTFDLDRGGSPFSRPLL